MKTRDYRDRLFSKSNIFLAIFSVHSYIFNKELLSEEDRNDLEALKDPFNEEKINLWVNNVSERLHRIIDDDEFLRAKVYFKPKKYDEEGATYRPLHQSSLLDLITAVSMLNLLIYDFDDKEIVGMSDLSRLIPHNFYGNRVAYDIKNLFIPWEVQYKKYNKKANELYHKYHENREYLWEVDLDLKNFFPSVNPLLLYMYVVKKLPVNLRGDNRDIILKILEKLIFIEIDELEDEDLKLYRGNKHAFKCTYAQGIPQGLPQSYFLANLLMIEIERKYRKVFPSSEMLFYVDDSVIFTNDIINEKELGDKIKELNKQIRGWQRRLLDKNPEGLTERLIKYVKEREPSYGIEVHKPGSKSTASNIAESKFSEMYLNCIGRETSKTAFELNTTNSDEESAVLLHKIDKLSDAIEKELDNIEKQIGSLSDNESSITLESYKKKLIRYKKFFKYRKYDLLIRSRGIDEQTLNDFTDKLKMVVDKKDLKMFFEFFSEDIFSALLSLILKEKASSKIYINEILSLVEELNCILFNRDNKDTSYLHKAFSRYSSIIVDKDDSVFYASLQQKVRNRELFFRKKSDDYRRQNMQEELFKYSDRSILTEEMGNDFVQMVKTVDANSPILRRMLLNAYISGILGFEISDDYLLHKKTGRKITYAELRILEMLRSKHFDEKIFFDSIDNFLDEEFNCAVDYSIFQVLGYYRTYVSSPDKIDKLILVHKYTCDIWRNGSKHLYFYTLHNQEHAVELVQNVVKIVRGIDYIELKKNDYYILFIACYLHDISMVTFPFLDAIQEDCFESNSIYSDFINDIDSCMKKTSWSDKTVKKLLKEYYLRIDGFYENLVRLNHAKDSAKEIRARQELSFIDMALREIVAEVSEAHGYDTADVYNKKSVAHNQNWSEKYTKIVLRMADLLDMSNYRVSTVILNHNICNMSEVSRFHWLSHIVTRGYKLDVRYEIKNDVSDNYLRKSNIIETIQLLVKVDLPQFTQVALTNCKMMNLTKVENNSISLSCGDMCNNQECNFLCKWFSKKNDYLFKELNALRKYLNSVPNNYFDTRIEVVVESTDRSILTAEQFTCLSEFIEK